MWHQWSVSNALYHVPWFLSSFKGTQGGQACMMFLVLRDFFRSFFQACFSMRSRVLLMSILVPIWPPIWTKIRPKIDENCVSTTPLKKNWKIYVLKSKIDAFKVEKYSKNDGGLFKITLFAYLQRSRYIYPETSYFGEVFGPRIEPKSIYNHFEIVIKNRVIFNHAF